MLARFLLKVLTVVRLDSDSWPLVKSEHASPLPSSPPPHPCAAWQRLPAAIPGIVIYVLTPELYATKYRAVGLGAASCVTRLGGLIAPMLAELLYDRGGPVAPLLVFGPIMIITGIAAGMIPVETAGRELDDDSWDRKEPAKTTRAFARPHAEPYSDAPVVP
ncbi:unnamed protein product [Ectocarpus sp. 12 AP-2014]